ncbi:Ail/Lom family outer membrane beta-barrel protein [Erwinia amylovora]|uniref:Ail/Lom family outer membrane beta-barrel protein n=1 Tax=Erwinia amylovora TaxID=552 RepID=UPI0002CCA878|nr:Ail/Lom family outer membrane beta-barrel protein [Erwinia amylovora]CCP06037.1 Virulence membrane protein pagC precursor [Erwinia amylovora MR1]
MNVKIMAIVLTFSALPASLLARADSHALSIGYAQSRVQDFKNLRGVNVKYRYEPESLLGVITSFSYMSAGGNEFDSSSWGDTYYDDSVKVKYFSLLIGPAYRINKHVSLYAVGGISNGKSALTQNYRNSNYTYTENSTDNTTSLAYGAGVQINPLENIVLDISYEGSKIQQTKINGFSMGIGYHF